MPETHSCTLLTQGVSVIVPVYNEEESLPVFIPHLDAFIAAFPYEVKVLFVDDGSTDRSVSLLEQTRYTVIRHPLNRGYGAAVKTGIEQASHEALVIIDADSTYHTEDMRRILEQLNESDMVIGARTGKDVHIPWMRRPVKWAIRLFASWIVGHRIPDLNSGLRAFRRSEAMKLIRLLPDGFSLTTTLTIAMHTAGKRVHYDPVNYAKRSGKSKFRPVSDTWNLILLILRTVVLIRPLSVFLPLSFLLLFAAMAVLILTKFIIPPYRFMDSTFTVLMMASIQMFVLGLIADLIVRINLWTP